MMTAGLYGAARIIAIDLDDNRIRRPRSSARRDSVNSGDADWRDRCMAMTDGLGVDVAIEAVGMPATFTDGHRARPRQAGQWRMSACTASRSS